MVDIFPGESPFGWETLSTLLINPSTAPYTALRALGKLCGTEPGLSFPPASSFGSSPHIRLHYLAIGEPISPGFFPPILMHQSSYLENNLANIFATAVLNDSSFQQIIVGGSNFGELCGAMTVFFTVNYIPTWVSLLFSFSLSHKSYQTDTVPSPGRAHASDRLVPTILQSTSESVDRSMEDGSHLHPHFFRMGSW